MTSRDEGELREALALEPADGEAVAELAALLRADSRHHELVELLLAAAEGEQQAAAQARLLAQMGQLYSVELGQPEQAGAVLSQALELDPDCVAALEQQANLHRIERRWTELYEVLQRLAALAEDPAAAAAHQLDMARLCEERLYEKDLALAAYERAVELDGSKAAALEALERLYREQQRWAPLADMLARRATLLDDAEQAGALLEQAAELCEEKLEQPERAIDLLEDALVLLPDHPPALRALQRLYRRARRFMELADLLSRQLQHARSTAERAELQLERAVVYEVDLQDPERALEAFEALHELDPKNLRALRGLARIHDMMLQWDPALEAMQQLARLEKDRARLADTHCRMGEIHKDIRGDAGKAELLFQEALASAPDHPRAMARLIDLSCAAENWGKATRMLDRAAEAEADPVRRARLLARAGAVHLEHLEDEARGVELLQRALADDPAQLRAAELLRPIYAAAGDHASLEPMLDLLLDRGADAPGEQRLELHLQLARTCEALGHDSRALQQYRMVLNQDPTHPEALPRLVDQLCRLGDTAEAAALLASVLEEDVEQLPDRERAALHQRLGAIQLQRQEHDPARASFQAALELDPTNRAALEAMGEASAEGGEWAAQVATKRELLVGAEGGERSRLLAECGEICLEKLDDPDQAAADFTDALEVDPENRRLLHLLLEAHQRCGRWTETVEVLHRQIALEQDPGRRSRYHMARATILRDELNDESGAVEAFNLALDDDPTLQPAFEAVDSMCQERGDPSSRVLNHRRMLERLTGTKGTRDLQVTLWHELGELLHGMNKLEDAVLALEVASKLQPQDEERLDLLAQLYGQLGPDHAARAIPVYHAQRQKDPNRTGPYRRLLQAYLHSHKLDEAYCVSAMLAFTGKADPAAQRLFEQHRDERLRRARGVLEEKLWRRHLAHDLQDPYIGAILALVTPAVSAATVRPPAAFKLREEQLREAALDPDPFCGLVAHMSRVLGVSGVDLYMDPERAGGLQVLHTERQPSLVAGRAVLRGRTDMEQAYAVAAALTMLRPEQYLRAIMTGPAELKTVVYIAFRLVQPATPVPPAELPAVERGLALVADRLQPDQQKQLRQLVGKFAASGKELKLSRWWRAAGLTANRAGFLLCNDLKTAMKMLLAEPAKEGDASPQRKMEDLVHFAASEDYFALRRVLGLALEPTLI